MHSDVYNIRAWFSGNKLTVNTDKRGTMLVDTRQKLNESERHSSVTMNQNILEDYAEISHLGLLLSKNLSWAKYICNLSSKCITKARSVNMPKCPRRCKTLYVCVNPHSSPTLISVYNWSFAPDVHIDKIQRVPCRMARLVSGSFE